MADKTITTDLAVIGAGPGGYSAAFYAADHGMQVTMIDPKQNPGGVCSFHGCIPSKALLHVAEIINEARHAKDFGISFTEPKINLKKLRDWKNDVVEKLTGGAGQLGKLRKVNHIHGTARFVDAGTIEIDENGKKSKLSFKHAIIATGSSPARVPGLSIDSQNVMDSTSALELESIPKTLLVIGGGYIGLEMGTVYATLGSKVTVVEMMDGLLPGVDCDLVRELSKNIESMFDEVLLNTTVESLSEQKNGIKVTLKGKEKKRTQRVFEKVLISVGRKPNSKNIGLENAGVKVNEKGFVEVNGQRRTNANSIFAIGDLVGEPMLAHKASHEGKIAVDAILGKKAAFEPNAIPAVVFTDPEIAWCGLTETEAKNKGLDITVTKFPWRASGRAITLGRSDGLTKHIYDSKTGRILGVGIVGPGAGELIAEGVLAVEMAALASDVHLSIHPHPTLSETMMEAAELFDGPSTHYMRAKRK